MTTKSKMIPLEQWDVKWLRDSLLGYLDSEMGGIEDDVEKGSLNNLVLTTLIPVFVDAGILLDFDGVFYEFDIHRDHDPKNYSPPKYDLRDDGELQRLEKLLRTQIESASFGQLVRYQRWADNVIMRS